MSDIITGLSLGILSFSMLNIGMVLEKKGADQLPKIENQSLLQNIKNFLSAPLWVIGWLMTTVQWYIYLIALPLAPISLLSAMMGVGLVVLVLFSYFYLKEPISKNEIVGMIGLIIGVVILSLTNTSEDATYTLDEMNAILAGAAPIIFTIIVLLFIIIPIIYSASKDYKYADVIFGIVSGTLMGLGAIYSKAFMSGILFNDLLGSLLNSIMHFQWWIYLVLLFIGNMGGMAAQQIGFQKGKAVVVAPLNSVMNFLIPVLGGVIIFSEWEGSSIEVLMLKVFALIILIIGVAIITRKSPVAQQEEIEEETK